MHAGVTTLNFDKVHRAHKKLHVGYNNSSSNNDMPWDFTHLLETEMLSTVVKTMLSYSEFSYSMQDGITLMNGCS